MSDYGLRENRKTFELHKLKRRGRDVVEKEPKQEKPASKKEGGSITIFMET